MNELKEAALEYAKKGLAVFPIVPRSKKPLTENGFKNATTDSAKIEEWWAIHPDANIGIATGDVSGGLVVIDMDIDKEKDKDGYHSFMEWCKANFLVLPDSWMSITGRGGYHLMFRSSFPVPSKIGWIEDVDIRANGGYIVAPPSIHPNGTRYEWEQDPSDYELITTDDIDVEFIMNSILVSNKVNGEPLKVPEEIPEGHRDEMMFKLACKYQRMGMSDEAMLAALLEENRLRCRPPLSEREIKQKVKQAQKYQKGEENKRQQREQKIEKLEFPELTKAKDLESEDLPDLKVYVGIGDEVPLLVEGTCILSAKSKLGKSWLSLELCDAVTKGNDFLGYKTNKCSALYFDFETGKKVRQNRLRKLTKIVGNRADTFYIVDKAHRMKEGFEEQIEHYMQMDPDIGVVIVDVFTKIVKPKPKEVADYEYYYDLISKLNDISRKYHLSIILVCHDRKTVDPSDPFANILGSTALQGATDQMMVMFKTRNYNDVVTHISVKGRTIDGIIDMDAQMKEGLWVRAENVAAIRKCEEYKKSAIYEGVKQIVAKNNRWRGKCSQFVQDCEEIGIELNLPLDKSGKTDFRPIGKAFQDEDFRTMLLDEKINLELTNPNSTGGKIYTLTVSTVSNEWVTVSENDANPYKI